jgi:hypothetical protein
MKFKLVLAISTFAAMSAFAQAQQGGVPPNAPTPTLRQVQQVLEIISGDKTKLQQYCDIVKLDQKIAEADRRNDTNSSDRVQMAAALASLDKLCPR